MADCLTGQEHQWVSRDIGPRRPDGLYQEPVLRFTDIPDEDHIDEVCINCWAFQVRAQHAALPPDAWLYVTYRGDEIGA